VRRLYSLGQIRQNPLSYFDRYFAPQLASAADLGSVKGDGLIIREIFFLNYVNGLLKEINLALEERDAG